MSQSKKGLYLVILLSTVFVFSFYGKIVFSPNSYLFSSKSDALKNYYTYAYYIENNEDVFNFEGLNYPYGEHFLYTDCTPVLSSTLRMFSVVIPGISNYSIGILNFLLILSFVFSAVLIYLILRKFDIDAWLAAFGALTIMMFAPQVFRLNGGHLALGFGFFLPLTWYLLLQFETSTKKMKYAVLLLISNLALFFVHAYLGMIAITFLLVYVLVKFLFEYRSAKNDAVYYYSLAGIIFIPILIFRALVFFTDTHTGRTTNPWGFFVHHSNPESIFLPPIPPAKTWLNSIHINYDHIWEGWAYIGLVSMAIILYYITVSIIKSVKAKKFRLANTWFNNHHLQYMMIASLFILLFAMAFPFKLGLERLLDLLSVLKQFRAIGRFAWVFYLVVTVSSIFFIDRLSKDLIKNNKKALAYLLMICGPMLFFIEALPYHLEASSQLTETNNFFKNSSINSNITDALETINTSDYQAIIPMPYYYIGSENFGKFASPEIYKMSQLVSYYTGLPIMGSYLTRTSIWESKNIMEVLSPGYYPKLIPKDLPSDKKFLIVDVKEEMSSYEQDIVQRSELVFDGGDFVIRTISKEELFHNNAEDEIAEFQSVRNSLILTNGFYSSDTSAILVYNDYESSPYSVFFRGKRGYRGEKKSWNKLAEFEPNTFEEGTVYMATFWMNNNGDNFGQDVLSCMVIVQEQLNEKGAWTTVSDPRYSLVINKDWSLIEIPFVVKEPEAEVTLLLKGDDKSNMPVYLDDLFIYKSGTYHYKIENETDSTINRLFKNNHQIKRPKPEIEKPA